MKNYLVVLFFILHFQPVISQSVDKQLVEIQFLNRLDSLPISDVFVFSDNSSYVSDPNGIVTIKLLDNLDSFETSNINFEKVRFSITERVGKIYLKPKVYAIDSILVSELDRKVIIDNFKKYYSKNHIPHSDIWFTAYYKTRDSLVDTEMYLRCELKRYKGMKAEVLHCRQRESKTDANKMNGLGPLWDLFYFIEFQITEISKLWKRKYNVASMDLSYSIVDGKISSEFKKEGKALVLDQNDFALLSEMSINKGDSTYLAITKVEDFYFPIFFSRLRNDKEATLIITDIYTKKPFSVSKNYKVRLDTQDKFKFNITEWDEDIFWQSDPIFRLKDIYMKSEYFSQ